MQGKISAIDHDKKVLVFRSAGVDHPAHYQADAFNRVNHSAGAFERDRLPFDYSYAVTCHKAQGGEWAHVLVIEQRVGTWDHARWAYTAASRARGRLVWY
jgi:ATP-dependent exoDNAse (exonuclease V) alpha subunit